MGILGQREALRARVVEAGDPQLRGHQLLHRGGAIGPIVDHAVIFGNEVIHILRRILVYQRARHVIEPGQRVGGREAGGRRCRGIIPVYLRKIICTFSASYFVNPSIDGQVAGECGVGGVAGVEALGIQCQIARNNVGVICHPAWFRLHAAIASPDVQPVARGELQRARPAGVVHRGARRGATPR